MKPTETKIWLEKTCMATGVVEKVDADIEEGKTGWYARIDRYTAVPIDDMWAVYYGFSDEWPTINGYTYSYLEVD